ncbi:MAG: 23S rRNA (guanosine(2251)-2'-O)-methyltransferase RlmB [Gammaproteobacteria bacterium]|nr:MAG: 23S rRNA (guanosine(2251)-2'-O)-methyltransferase RlmB [Gammaproteobacteria bacterium]
MKDKRFNLLYGLHTIEAVLEASPDLMLQLWADEKRHDARIERIVHAAQQAGIHTNRVSRKKLIQLLGEGRPAQGLVAKVKPAATGNEQGLIAMLDNLDSSPFLLVLDGIQDPHNLGACLRTAEAAGVQAVILPKDRSAPLTAVARRAAVGAAERLPLFEVTNLARCLKALKDKGVWIMGASGTAEHTLYQTDMRGPLAMVVGSEGQGMRRLTREQCDLQLRIPMMGAMESLNVSVATGIMLFEARRQRTNIADI